MRIFSASPVPPLSGSYLPWTTPDKGIRHGQKTIEKVDIKGKRVFIRADFNVPLDENGNITDDGRIRSTLPTINYAIDEGAKVILASHLGRPGGKPSPKYSLAPVAKRLNRLLNKEVKFLGDCIGPDVEHTIKGMRPGDVVLLENLRFHPEEEKNDEGFSKALAALTDVYVNDAFGTAHRAHASTYGITKQVKYAVAGFPDEEGDRLPPEYGCQPRTAVRGHSRRRKGLGQNRRHREPQGQGEQGDHRRRHGLHVPEGPGAGSGQLPRRTGNDGRGPAYPAKRAGARGEILSARRLRCGRERERRGGNQDRHRPGNPQGMDRARHRPCYHAAFSEAIQDAKTIIWNGPMGLFEKDAYSRGTFAIARAVADSYALTIVGGGDTDVAVHRAGVSDSISFISTGGGASLELLEGKELPGLAALTDDKD